MLILDKGLLFSHIFIIPCVLISQLNVNRSHNWMCVQFVAYNWLKTSNANFTWTDWRSNLHHPKITLTTDATRHSIISGPMSYLSQGHCQPSLNMCQGCNVAMHEMFGWHFHLLYIYHGCGIINDVWECLCFHCHVKDIFVTVRQMHTDTKWFRPYISIDGYWSLHIYYKSRKWQLQPTMLHMTLQLTSQILWLWLFI